MNIQPLEELFDPAWCRRIIQLGFTDRQRSVAFIRPHEELEHWVLVIQSTLKDGSLRLGLGAGVRAAKVEELLFASKMLGKVGSDPRGPLLQGPLYALAGRRMEFWTLQAEHDIRRFQPDWQREIESVALPWFELFNSLGDIDAEVNKEPNTRHPWCGGEHTRCAIGVAVATLVKNPRRSELVETYRAKIAKMSKGFFLERFDELLRLCDEVSQHA